METIVILTESTKHPYHQIICNEFLSLQCFSNYIFHQIDIELNTSDHQYFQQIQTLNPAIVITMDLAGFRFRTQLGRTSLNILPAKILNLVWGNKKEYAPFLSQNLSLSMHFFDCSQTPVNLMEHYPNINYYNALGTLPDEIPLSNESKDTLLQISECFLSEIGI